MPGYFLKDYDVFKYTINQLVIYTSGMIKLCMLSLAVFALHFKRKSRDLKYCPIFGRFLFPWSSVFRGFIVLTASGLILIIMTITSYTVVLSYFQMIFSFHLTTRIDDVMSDLTS